MRDWLHAARSFIIAPELFVVALLVFAWLVLPTPFIWAERAIEKLEWFYLMAPFGVLLGSAIALCWKILFPPKNSGLLSKWPQYPQLRLTTLCALLFVVIGATSTAIGVVGRGALAQGVTALLVASGYVIAGISVFTMLAAALTIRSIVSHGN